MKPRAHNGKEFVFGVLHEIEDALADFLEGGSCLAIVWASCRLKVDTLSEQRIFPRQFGSRTGTQTSGAVAPAADRYSGSSSNGFGQFWRLFPPFSAHLSWRRRLARWAGHRYC